MPHSLVRFCRTNHFCADVHPSAVAPGETPHAINNAGADGLDVTSRFTSVDGSLSALNACVQMCASKEKNGFLFPLRHGPIEIASSPLRGASRVFSANNNLPSQLQESFALQRGIICLYFHWPAGSTHPPRRRRAPLPGPFCGLSSGGKKKRPRGLCLRVRRPPVGG